MRQSSRQNQPAKTGSVQLASPRSVPPEQTGAHDHSPSRAAAPPLSFDFGKIPVYGRTPVGIQPKLTIGAPGDALEQEADRVAEQVMRLPEPPARSHAQAGRSDHPAASANQVQTKSSHAGDSGGSTAPPIVHDVLRSPGQPLDATTRAFMEPRFGHDFGKIRVHADDAADRASRSLGARAFTYGQNIAFRDGQYDPGSAEGARLLAHELTHTVQQDVGNGPPQIQRAPGGDDVGKKLAEKEYKDALDKCDIDYLVKHRVGKNILDELSMPRGIGSEKPITVLQAGALALSFGMLRLRQEYIKANSQKEDAGDFAGMDPLIDPLTKGASAALDPTALAARYAKLKALYVNNPDKSKNDDRRFKDETEKLVNIVLNNPDMAALSTDKKSTRTKQSMLRAIDADAGLTLNPLRQDALRGDITAQAKRFFDKMKKSNWIAPMKGIDKEKIEMPDQFLAAVGDRTDSTGLAKSKGGVGEGYFMYGQTAPSNTYPGDTHKQTRAHPLYANNTLKLTYPASGPLQILMSAYGFDPLEEGGKEPMNRYATEVTVSADENKKPIFSAKFTRNKVVISGGAALEPDVNKGSISVTIPRGYSEVLVSVKAVQAIYDEDWPKNPKKRAEAMHRIAVRQTYNKEQPPDIPRTDRDTDEVQVQISTTGKITIPGTEPLKRKIKFSPRPNAAVEARELFESGSFTANIDYVKNQDSKAEILGFAKSLNDKDIIDIVGGTRSLDSIFTLTGGGVNPATEVPKAKDKKTDKDVDRFGLQDYPAAELANLYKEKPSAQDYFDSLRSAKATKGRAAAGFTTYNRGSYSTAEELSDILKDHGVICHDDWPQTVVSIEDATTNAKLSDEEVAGILRANNITNYGDKPAQNNNKIDIASFTSPLGIAGGPGGGFEKNYQEGVRAGSETDKQLRPIMQGAPKTLGRRNNDLLSALRAADFVKYLLLQKARQMDDQQKSGTKWVNSLHEAFVKRNLLVTVNVTGEHGTEQKPVPVKIYMKDIPEPKVK